MSDNMSTMQSAAELTRRMGRFALVLGICLIILGVLILVRPDVPLLLLAVLIGIQLLFLGVIRVVSGTTAGGVTMGWRVLVIVAGVLTAVAGAICLFKPNLPLVFLAILLGVGWMVDGIATLVATLRGSRGHSRTSQLIYAGCSIVAGLLVVIWPEKSLMLMAQLIGVIFIVLGVVAIVTAAPQLRATSSDVRA